jgi:hypothetical protein
MRQFIGEWGFNSDESICSVARPFNGDVLFVDTASFAVRGKCTTGSPPVEAILIDEVGVIARDWKTGQLLRTSLAGSS